MYFKIYFLRTTYSTATTTTTSRSTLLSISQLFIYVIVLFYIQSNPIQSNPTQLDLIRSNPICIFNTIYQPFTIPITVRQSAIETKKVK